MNVIEITVSEDNHPPTTTTILNQVEYYVAFIASFMGLCVIIWTVNVVRSRLTLNFVVILSLYTCIYLLRITKSFLKQEKSFFDIFSNVVSTAGVATIDIVMYIVVLQMKELKAKIASETHEQCTAKLRQIKIEKIVLITLSVLTAAVKIEIDLRYNKVFGSHNFEIPMIVTILEVTSTVIRLITNSYMTS
jgi:hypothetical protein